MGQACSEPNLNKGLKRSSSSRVLPDVSHEQKADVEGVLDQVGMSNIEVPLKLAVKDYGTFMVPAKINAYVNLPNAQSKGIHMSRLYIKLQESFEKNIFDIKHLKDILKQFVQEQDGLSDKSFVRINFKLPVKRKALISEAKGWRFYPVWIKAVYNEKQNQFQ